jgi:phosphate uptake regulator
MKIELEELTDSLEKESADLQKSVQKRDEMNDKKNRLDAEQMRRQSVNPSSNYIVRI